MFSHSNQWANEKAKVSCHYRPGPAGYPLAGFLYVFLIPIDELTKKLRFLAIAVLHPPLGQASYPLAGIPICFSYSHQWINEKGNVSCHYRPGQAGYHLAGFLYVFLIPIDELMKKLRFLAIPVLHPTLRQASYPLARIPICFYHSRRWTNEKAKDSCHSRPTPLP